MRVAYYTPNPQSIYAGRTILSGYRNAWIDLGHTFDIHNIDQPIETFFDTVRPDILMTGISDFFVKFLDLELFLQLKKKHKTKVFVSVPFWKSPLSKLRVNETPSLSQQAHLVELIKSGRYGDVYYNICPPGDPRMDGFEQATGYRHETVLLAADKTILPAHHQTDFISDISFVGTYLPEKREIFRNWVEPMRNNYVIRYYGQDWTPHDRIVSLLTKAGQYYNIPILKNLQKPQLTVHEDAAVYASTNISINIHETYQRRFGLDCNERTFKIPACGGFEVVDDVACIRQYFKEGEEMVIARDRDDFQEKIRHYLKYPDERIPMIKAGQDKVLKYHTYHNRVSQLLSLYYQL